MNKYVFLTQEQYDKALESGVSANTLEVRLKKGWDLDKAINTPLVKRGRGKLHDEQLIITAQRNGINYSTFKKRLRNGWSKERASTVPIWGEKEGKQCKKAICS